jgi:hypothetical protein
MVLLPEILSYREVPIFSITQCSCGFASQSVDARCALTCAELSIMTDARRPKSRAPTDSATAVSTNQSIEARRVIAAQLNGIPHGHDEFAG